MTDVVDVRRAQSRFHTTTDWLDSWHSFSYGPHYDPTNTHFGFLLASNDDVVQPAGGFQMHRHRDMEIVTWVVSGSLTHEDSTRYRGEVRPGLVQAMSTGTGILHSERNAAAEPVRYVQMWLVPSQPELPPSYAQADIESDLRRGGLVPIASGAMDAPIPIRQRGATLYAGRLPPGESAVLPTASYVHLYVVRGSIELERASVLQLGDAARITVSEGRRITATIGTEVLVWAMSA
jgi:redox-sensitive bicupin YhaK (pirin superfamily)